MTTNLKMLGMGMAAFGLSACATSGPEHMIGMQMSPIQEPVLQRPVGTQTLIYSLPAVAPAWVGAEKAFSEEGGNLFYRGAVDNRMDMALGVREARAEAEKNMVEQVKQLIGTQFGSAIKGDNREGGLGFDVLDLIVKVTDAVEISGAKLSSQFVQKFEEQTPGGVRYIWDCYALVSISKADYLEARRRTFDGAVASARAEKNAKAEVMLRDAFRKLERRAPAATVVDEQP